MNLDTNRPIVFGVAPYINVAPLAAFIPVVSPRGRVLTIDTPAHLPSRVMDGTADAAIIPVIDLFDHPFDMVPGIGICAEATVQSVLLKCNRPLRQVRTVAMDRASHTSNALTYILLRESFGLNPQMLPGGSGTCDAEVVIGDRALSVPAAPCGDCDLAELWHALTGLPFVFAVWGYRKDNPQAEQLAAIAHAARRAGLAAVGDLARQEARRTGLDEARIRNYLQNVLYYNVGEREQSAMALFRQLVSKYAAELPSRADATASREAV